MLDALDHRNPAAESEDQNRYDQAPEILFLAISERMGRIDRSLAAVQSDQQQDLIQGINCRMDTFGQHRGATGHTGGNELGDRHAEVASESSVDDNSGFGH